MTKYGSSGGIATRLTKGAAWIAATRVFVNLAGLASTLILARLLSPSDFGLVTIATTVVTIVSSVTDLSLSSALIQHKDPNDEHFNSAFTLNLGRAALIAVVIALIGTPVSYFYHDPRIAPVMIVIAISTLLTGFLNPKVVIFSRGLVFWQEFVLGVSQKVTGLVAATAVAYVYKTYWALVVGIVSTSVASVLVSYLLAPYRPRLQVGRVRELLSFSIWLSLGQAVNTLNWKFDHLVIGYFLGNGPLGFYAVGDSLAVLPTREATTPIAQTLFPGFAQVVAESDRLRSAYQRGQALLCAIALPVGFGFAILSRPLVLLTMGVKWLPAVEIIQLLSAIFALQTLSSAIQPLAMAKGETKMLFNRDVLNLIIRIPMVIVGMVAGGLVGIVYARCVSGIANTLVNMALAKRLLNVSISEQLMANGRALISVILMSVGMLLNYHTMGTDVGRIELLNEMLQEVLLGSLLYLIATATLWKLAGLPRGPESEIFSIISKAYSRIRPPIHH